MTNEVGSAVVGFSTTGQLLDQTLRDPFADIRYENGQTPASLMTNGIHSSFRFPALWLKNKVVTKNTLFEASKELRIDSGITLQGGASAIFSGNSDVALKLETTISHTDPRSWYRLSPQVTPSRSITLTYTGKRQDPDTNLFYFNARWVDPELGQFISLDPSGIMPTDSKTLNLYEYCGNNPVKNIDWTGRATRSVQLSGVFATPYIGIAGGAGIVKDNQGNVGIKIDLGLRFGAETSGGLSYAQSNNFDMYKLQGFSMQGSAGIGFADSSVSIPLNNSLPEYSASSLYSKFDVGASIGPGYSWVFKIDNPNQAFDSIASGGGDIVNHGNNISIGPGPSQSYAMPTYMAPTYTAPPFSQSADLSILFEDFSDSNVFGDLGGY